MLGVVAVLVLQDQASGDTLLYLSLNLIGLLFRSRVGSEGCPPIMPYRFD